MYSSSDLSWCEREFAGIDFGDIRLVERFKKTVLLFSLQPQASINKACGDWKTTKAAYRMLDNDKLDSTEIGRQHLSQVLARAQNTQVILAVQDTTMINYSTHDSTEGLGHIGTSHSKNVQGLMMHTTLAITGEGLPIGILRQDIWARDKKPKHPKKNGKRDRSYKNLDIQEKESMKWVRSLESLNDLKSKLQAKLISVGDRESDVYEYIQRANSLEIGFLIRAVRDRIVVDGKHEKPLWEYMSGLKPVGQLIEVEVPAKKGSAARVAKVSIRFSEVLIKAPMHRPSVRNSLPEKVYSILVQEMKSPRDTEPLEWMLLTNEKVKTINDAIKIVGWYKQRWHIENFHKVLKSGCTVEACRLGTAEKLNRYLTIFSIIACRLYWITHIGRTEPDHPCTILLEDHEWKALDCVVHGTAAPRETYII